MIETDEGLVLRTFKLGETSKIVSLLGRRHGKLRLVARGARTSRTRHAACLELGNEIDIVFSSTPGRELGALRESSLRHAWLSGARKLEVLASGLAILELLDRLVPQGASEEGLLHEARQALRVLHARPDRQGALIVFCTFETLLLASFGLLPHLEACAQCGASSETLKKATLDLVAGRLLCPDCGASGPKHMRFAGGVVRILRDLAREPWPQIARSSIEADDLRSVGRILHRLLEAHLEAYRVPRSLQLLRTPGPGPLAPVSTGDQVEPEEV